MNDATLLRKYVVILSAYKTNLEALYIMITRKTETLALPYGTHSYTADTHLLQTPLYCGHSLRTSLLRTPRYSRHLAKVTKSILKVTLDNADFCYYGHPNQTRGCPEGVSFNEDIRYITINMIITCVVVGNPAVSKPIMPCANVSISL